MKYTFWNTHKNKDINVHLQNLIEEYSPDIVALAEYEANGEELENKLKLCGLDYVFISKIASRLDLFYKGNRKEVIHCNESKYYTIKIISNNKKKQIISIVHLPSKMYEDEFRNAEILKDMLEEIVAIKVDKHINNFVVMGDFNMNPYELPMINATALQAISSREIVKKRKQRIYNDKNRELLYNPMWNFLGDEKKPIGSYYYPTSQNAALYWNTFDQFIVNEKLVDVVDLSKIKFITTVGTLELADESGRPKVSDHFPLYFEIGEEE